MIKNIIKELIYLIQKLKYGFSNTELWNLDNTISKFVLPRLIRFKQVGSSSHPSELTPEEWEIILNKMINSFQLMLQDDFKYTERKEITARQNKINAGLKLFAKYYQNLWY
jgi:hypothetical protein